MGQTRGNPAVVVTRLNDIQARDRKPEVLQVLNEFVRDSHGENLAAAVLKKGTYVGIWDGRLQSNGATIHNLGIQVRVNALEGSAGMSIDQNGCVGPVDAQALEYVVVQTGDILLADTVERNPAVACQPFQRR